MDLYAELMDRLRSFLEGRLTLERFEDWFVPATWQPSPYRSVRDPSAFDLAKAVDLRLAEHSTQHWTEPELRQKLIEELERHLADLQKIEPWIPPNLPITGSQALVEVSGLISFQPAGRGSSSGSSLLVHR